MFIIKLCCVVHCGSSRLAKESTGEAQRFRTSAFGVISAWECLIYHSYYYSRVATTKKLVFYVYNQTVYFLLRSAYHGKFAGAFDDRLNKCAAELGGASLHQLTSAAGVGTRQRESRRGAGAARRGCGAERGAAEADGQSTLR